MLNNEPPRMEQLIPLFANPDEQRILDYEIRTSDDLTSRIVIKGAFDIKETWWGDMYFANSRSFLFSVYPAKNTFYTEGDRVSIRPLIISERLKVVNGFKGFPASYTDTPKQCAVKLKKWLIENAKLVNA